MFFLHETRITLGESAATEKTHNLTHRFVDNPGRSLWTEPESPRGGEAFYDVLLPLFQFSNLTHRLLNWNTGKWVIIHRTGWLFKLPFRANPSFSSTFMPQVNRPEREDFYLYSRGFLTGPTGTK